MKRTKIAGAALLAGGAFLGRETVVWAYNRALDAFTAGFRGGVHFIGLSWENGIAAGLIFVGIGLLAWPRHKHVAAPDPLPSLCLQAMNIIARVRQHRDAKWFQRDRLEPTSDIARDGISLLVSFEKAGFAVPRFDVRFYEQIAAGLEAYFSALVPLLKQSHYIEAKTVATSAAENAQSEATKLNPQTEWFYPDF